MRAILTCSYEDKIQLEALLVQENYGKSSLLCSPTSPAMGGCLGLQYQARIPSCSAGFKSKTADGNGQDKMTVSAQ